MKPRVPKHVTAFAQKLRHEPTKEEVKLWGHLRQRQLLGWHFRRQHPVPPYVADFACLKAMLIVELDGSQHGGTHDAVRDAFLTKQGWRVLRFSNEQLAADMDYVLGQIAAALQVPPPPSRPSPSRGKEK